MENFHNEKMNEVSVEMQNAFWNVMLWMDAMEERGGGNPANWELFFKSKDYQKVCLREEYLVELKRLLGRVMVDEETAYVIHQEVQRIGKLLEDASEKAPDDSRVVMLAQIDEKVEVEKKRHLSYMKRTKKICFIVITAIFFVLLLAVGVWYLIN